MSLYRNIIFKMKSLSSNHGAQKDEKKIVKYIMHFLTAIDPNIPPDTSRFKQRDCGRLTNKLPLEATHMVDDDTIELSESGQKTINLARATKLGAELPNFETDPTRFNEALKRGYEKIKRVTRLFSEVLYLLRRRL